MGAQHKRRPPSPGLLVPLPRFLACSLYVILLVACLNIPGLTANILHDQCPDTMDYVLEYHSIPQFKTTKAKTAHKESTTCVLVTQCTVDRFSNLEKQAMGWNGHISAAVYIFTTSEAEVNKQMNEVKKFVNKLNSADGFQGVLTVSLLFGHENAPWRWKCDDSNSIGAPLYPINALRNLATAAASIAVASSTTAVETTTETHEHFVRKHHEPPTLIFTADVDFIPSPGLLEWASRDTVMEKCGRGELVVVPAFEVNQPSKEQASLQFILNEMKTGNAYAFHASRFPPGHKPTNYTRWANLSIPLVGQNAAHNIDTYEVQYSRDYEPYTILSSKHYVAYDERFRGYGQNKAIQLKWLVTRNHTLNVLPGHFVAADHHENSQISGKVMMTVTRDYMMHTYYKACKEMELHKLPQVSSTNAALLTAAGLGHSFEHV